MTDFDGLASAAYRRGESPLDWAETSISILIEVHIWAWSSRIKDPESFPGYPIDLTLDALARRILGNLLDAGWTAPAAGGEE